MGKGRGQGEKGGVSERGRGGVTRASEEDVVGESTER